MKDELKDTIGTLGLFLLFIPILALYAVGMTVYAIVKAAQWIRQAWGDFWTVNYDEQAHRFWKP